MHATQIGRYLPLVLPCARLLARLFRLFEDGMQRRVVEGGGL